MKVRYKKSGQITYSGSFNMNALGEVLTGDDSPFISELDVFIEKSGEWLDMSKAFRNRDLIVNNYNSHFFEPQTEKDKQRGYTLNW
jgi:hypothetical protein